MNSANIHVNDIYIPLLTNKDRYMVLFGGAGSGKSVFAVQKLIIRVTTESPHRILVVRKVATTLKESVFKLIKSQISALGITHEFVVNRTDKTFTHVPTGNEIICEGLDDPEKLKSITDITSIWIEEATELNEDDFDQIDLRMRGETARYKQLILTFNPIDERHWLKKRFFDFPPESTTTLRTTYNDNFFIDAEYKQVLEAKAHANPNYYRIYKLGEWGKAEVQTPYVSNFNPDIHISDQAVLRNLPIIFSIDFNVQPLAAVCSHDWTDSTGMHHHFFKEIKLDVGDTQKLVDVIKSQFTPLQIANALFTGDATGRRRDVNQRNNVSSWSILQSGLGISNSRLKVPLSNQNVAQQRSLINLYFSVHPDLKFHPSMTTTINELRYTECAPDGSILKKDRSKLEQRADFLDCVRYSIATFHSDFEKRVPGLVKR